MILSRLRISLAAALALSLALLATACGNKEEEHVNADNEAAYLDVGGLSYQVQVSRELNRADREDRGYLLGLPPSTPPLRPDESWFGVFLTAFNENDEGAAPLARRFRIVDTEHRRGTACIPSNGCYLPVAQARVNQFAYNPVGPVLPGESYPLASTAARDGVIGGALLLFRIPYVAYDNRPLTLEVQDPTDPRTVGTIALDI